MKDTALDREASSLFDMVEEWVFQDLCKDECENELDRLQSINEEVFHIRTVASVMALLAPGRDLDPGLGKLIGLLHDVGRLKSYGTLKRHAEAGAEMVEEFLKEKQLLTPIQRISVVSAVRHHSSKGKIHGPYDELLKDADVFHRFLEGDPNLQKPSWNSRATKVLNEFVKLSRKKTNQTLKLSSKDCTVRQGYFRLVSQAEARTALWQDMVLDASLVHEIRVYLRQMKALLYLFKPLMKSSAYRKSQQCLKKALQSFEAAREAWVELEAVRGYVAYLHAENTSECIISNSADRNLAWAAAWEAYLEQRSADYFLNEQANSWRKPLRKCFKEMESAVLRKRISRMPLNLFVMNRLRQLMVLWLSEFGQCDFKDDVLIHRSRIDVKKIRYSLRAASSLTQTASSDLLGALEIYQTAAGRLHDVVVSRSLVEKAQKVMKMTCEDVVKSAVEDFVEAQEAYLSFRNRQGDTLRVQLEEAHYQLVGALSKWISAENQ